MSHIDRLVRDKVRCIFDDLRCIAEAEKNGEEFVLTDDDGEILVDDGQPISDPNRAAAVAGKGKAPAPGEGVWANYDFVPGDHVLHYEDYAGDNVGDFPRRMELIKGNWEIVDWEGRRLLRNTGPRASAVKIVLPRALPERFTIEFDAYVTHGNHQLILTTAAPTGAGRWQSVEGHVLRFGWSHGTGVEHPDQAAVRSVNRTDRLGEGLTPIRLMVDGRYAKVYVGERRVANVPNADFPRGTEIVIENIYAASETTPVYIGSIRVAEGGRDLYDKLATDGRVATHGILFAVNSARIRPESTPTLQNIGTMLRDHSELRLRIEGHTDASGADDFNQTLSDDRAAAARAYLIEKFGIAAGRLEAAGFGETTPVDSNDTPEGRQNNRRVELVRLDR
jgi:outer membrane protein OmpA-like peptidoglycan-associated protein